MSWHEALEDGILIEEDSKKNKCYYPPCHICGSQVYSWSYNRGTRYTCEKCRTELVRQTREEGRAVSADKKQKKLEDAIKRISKVAKISQYEKAMLFVRNSLYKHGWYQSTEEIMVALELIRCGVKAHHQVRIFNYTVDFILPEMKVALEIDGKIFHGKDQLNYQKIRDDAIIFKLGDGWELIRISTENINMNITRLIPAITAVLKKRNSENKIVKDT